jgi:hypothetical protein
MSTLDLRVGQDRASPALTAHKVLPIQKLLDNGACHFCDLTEQALSKFC